MRCFAVGVAVLLLVATSATATTVTAHFSDVTPFKWVTVTGGGVTHDTTKAGLFNFDSAKWREGVLDIHGNATGTVITTDDTHPQTFVTFCIDLKQYVYYNWTNSWDVLPAGQGPVPGPNGHTMASWQVDELSHLYGGYYASILTGGLSVGGSGDANTEAAAFQAAVWEIVWESYADVGGLPPASDPRTLSLTADNLHLGAGDATVANRANAMLTNLQSEPLLTIQALVDPSHQDQVVYVPAGGVPPVHAPEPLTMAGLFLGLASVAGYIRKRRMA